MKLSSDQTQAIDGLIEFLDNDQHDLREAILCGESGAGKTTVVKQLLEDVYATNETAKMLGGIGFYPDNTVLTATTNQAAKVFSKAVGKECKTIHNLLGLQVINDFQTGKTKLKKTRNTQVISNSLIIIDEASMIDEMLLKMIKELSMNCKIIYVGDDKQLPPVGYVDCPVFKQNIPTYKLTTIHRQAMNCPIKELGRKYRETVTTSDFPTIEPSIHKIELLDGSSFKAVVENYFDPSTKDHRNLKILAYSNAKVNAYNQFVRSMYTTNPAFEAGEFVVTAKPIVQKGSGYSPTDTILEIISVGPPYDKNGITGYDVKLSNDAVVFQANDYNDVNQAIKNAAKLAKKNGSWVDYFNFKDNFADLRSVHASTVHKAQGQTYDIVFIDLSDIGRCTKWYEIARMLYVATTRAKEKVYFYGELPLRLF